MALNQSEAIKALKEPEFADFVIRCGGSDAKFSVHKFLICAKSDFLAACVKGPFREGVQNELTVKETTPLAVASVVYYIYAGTYSIEEVVRIWAYGNMLARRICKLHDQSVERSKENVRARLGFTDTEDCFEAEFKDSKWSHWRQ